MSNNRSFFEKITGSIYLKNDSSTDHVNQGENIFPLEADENEAEMAIDMYQTKDEIVIMAMPAGVKPDDVDISINNDVVKISAKRSDPEKINENSYLSRELYWGAFSRTVILPQEVDAEKSDAIFKEGLLILHLPKIDRVKIKNLKVNQH